MSRTLDEFARDLRRLPKVVQLRIAEEAAPALTALARATFEASENAYGVGWKPGEHGQRVTLVKSGALKGFLVYKAAGTKIRVSLGVPYAKYQIGRRPVFPRGALPAEYSRTLQRIAVRIVKEELGR